MSRRITVRERRARLARRHHLAPETLATTVADVADDLVALHATDPATVHLAARARLAEPSVTAVEEALYEERSLVRMLAMRRTMFVVPRDLVPVVQAAAADAVAAAQRKLLIQHLTEASGGVVENPATWLKEVGEATVRALAGRGQATATELAQDEPRLRTQLTMAEGKSYSAVVNVTTRVLTVLAAEGRIIRGRPRGSWISSQYRWSTAEDWLPGEVEEWPVAAARTLSSPGGGPGRCRPPARWNSSANGRRSASPNPGPVSTRSLSSTRPGAASGCGRKTKADRLGLPPVTSSRGSR